MMKNKKIIFSFLYVILALSFFMVYLFPADEIKKYMLSKLNIPDSAFAVSIARVKPAFPPGLTLKEVSIFHQNNLVFNAEMLKLTPRVWTLLGSKTTLAVAGKAGGGIFSGRMDMNKGDLKQQATFHTKLTGVQFEHNPALKNLLNMDISGVVDGNITFAGNRTAPQKFTAQLVISNCKIKLPPGILKTGLLEFKNIKTDLSAKEKRISIENCSFQGSQMNGSISGTILLMNPVSKSRMDLNGSIQPHYQLLKDLGGNFPAGGLNKKRQKNNRLSVHIGGTIAKPTFF